MRCPLCLKTYKIRKWLAFSCVWLCLVTVIILIRHKVLLQKANYSVRNSFKKLDQPIPIGAKTIGYGTMNLGHLPWYDDQYGVLLPCEKRCVITSDTDAADGVIFAGMYLEKHWLHQPHLNQLWMIYTSESPVALKTYIGDEAVLKSLAGIFNVVDSFQRNSELQNIGSYGYMRIQTLREQKLTNEIGISLHLKEKTDLVVGMISMCDQNSGRIEYIQEMKKHILSSGKTIHVYGQCLDGERCESKYGQDECKPETFGRRFKFYLAFENSRCRDYITEKFWVKGLRYDMVPIVNGGLSKMDYEKVAPPHSYIHIDDFNDAQELVSYLIALDNDDTAYNEYFKWKETYILDGVNLLPDTPCPENPAACTDRWRYCGFCDILHNTTWDKSHTADLLKAFSVEKNCR